MKTDMIWQRLLSYLTLFNCGHWSNTMSTHYIIDLRHEQCLFSRSRNVNVFCAGGICWNMCWVPGTLKRIDNVKFRSSGRQPLLHYQSVTTDTYPKYFHNSILALWQMSAYQVPRESRRSDCIINSWLYKTCSAIREDYRILCCFTTNKIKQVRKIP